MQGFQAVPEGFERPRIVVRRIEKGCIRSNNAASPGEFFNACSRQYPEIIQYNGPQIFFIPVLIIDSFQKVQPLVAGLLRFAGTLTMKW